MLVVTLGLALITLATVYRRLWRRRHLGAGGLACRRGSVSQVADGQVRIDCDGAPFTLSCRQRLVVHQPVVLEGIEVGPRFEPHRLRRGVWPELSWLHRARLVTAAVVALALPVQWSTAQEPPPGLSRTLTVARAVRAAAVPQQPSRPTSSALSALQRRLEPLQRPLRKPAPGDWLAQHRETGQTLRQYIQGRPAHARGRRAVLYVEPLGRFVGEQQRLLRLTADFMSRYLCLQTRVLRPVPLSVIPATARRRSPLGGQQQLLTGFVLHRMLAPRLADDAAAHIALTTVDLWPGRGWNFVFGEASIRGRVGIWSLHRMGNPRRELNLSLLRTIKTAVHEAGHMLSMHHCTAHSCNMNGSNSLAEADRQPLPLCSQCLAKLIWATGCDPVRRYRGLVAFFAAQGMTAQQQRYRTLLAALARD